MEHVRLRQAITKAELHRRLRAWLATGEEQIGPSDVGTRTAWVHIRGGERGFVLHANTNRLAVKEYLSLVRIHGDDIEWRVVENRKGKMKAVAFGPDATRPINAMRLYLLQPKGRIDTPLKTANPDSLSRKLTAVAQHVVITTHDCGTTQGISKGIMCKGDEIDRPLSDAIRGRVSRDTIQHPTTGAILLEENELITPARAEELERMGIDRITIRSPMTCIAPRGVCRLCYGTDSASGAIVADGTPVGLIAARSISEFRSQLTGQPVHTSGLFRVMELFEARRPRNPTVIAEMSGRVRIDPTLKRGKRIIEVIPETENERWFSEARAHQVPVEAQLRVQQDEYVKYGDRLVHGTPAPRDILRVMGEREVQAYLVREVQSVYRSQKVNIDDKHIEIIVARMLRKVRVYEPGDTDLMHGSVVDKFAFCEVNRRYTEEYVKVKDPGDTALIAGRVYSKEAFEGESAALGEEARKPTFQAPEAASCETHLLGITEAAE